MRTLLLMRHAKSSWDDPDLGDHDRPLNKRGQRDAPRMGTLLQNEGLVPDRIIASSALRARQTAELLAPACGFSACVDVTPELYHADEQDWSEQIRQIPGETTTALCIGHNPGLEDFLATAVGQYIRMPTAAIAQLSVRSNGWQTFDPHHDTTLVTVWRPKDIDQN